LIISEGDKKGLGVAYVEANDISGTNPIRLIELPRKDCFWPKTDFNLFGYDVRFRGDCVEKVVSGVGTNFLRAAGALGVLGRGGPFRPERIRPAAFLRTLRAHRLPKSKVSQVLREFCRGSIFDFFNTIGGRADLRTPSALKSARGQ
jgi:hypothetical protein